MHAWMLFHLLISQFLHYTKSKLVYTHYTLHITIYIHMHTLYAIIYPSLHQEYSCLHTLHTTHYYLHTHSHAIRYYLHTHYYLLTPSFYHFLQQMIIVAIVLVAEHDFIEDSVGIAHKLHNFILTFHCSVYHSRYRGHLSEANNKVSIAI